MKILAKIFQREGEPEKKVAVHWYRDGEEVFVGDIDTPYTITEADVGHYMSYEIAWAGSN